MHDELLVPTEGDERGQRHAAAGLAVEARTRPDLAPRVPGDEILELAGEVGRPLDGAVDVLVSEHFAADAHTLVVAHSDRTASTNTSGCSTFARWAASSSTIGPAPASRLLLSSSTIGSWRPRITVIGTLIAR